MDDDGAAITTLKILIIGESGVGKSRLLLINSNMCVYVNLTTSIDLCNFPSKIV